LPSGEPPAITLELRTGRAPPGADDCHERDRQLGGLADNSLGDNVIIVTAKQAPAGGRPGPKSTGPTGAGSARQPLRSAQEGKTRDFRTLGK
jgi:hypothetical protein